MRIEDVDRGRIRPGAEEQILTDLRWLGFDWDEGPDVGGDRGPYRQSERSGSYEDALTRLSERLFECSCSRKEVRGAAGVPDDHRGELRYPGTCRDGPKAPQRSERSLRARVEASEESWDDLWLGLRTDSPEQVCGDFILRAKNGDYTYQLACSVDDLEMGISHVLRGEDLVDSTGRQLLLRRWLGAESPLLFAHTPLRVDGGGERLAKSRGSVGLGELREAGEAPQRLLGDLAFDLGLVDHQGLELRPHDLLDPFMERMPQLLRRA